MKSLKKFFSVFIICILLSLTFGSNYLSCYNVNASGTISDYIDKLTNYFLTITGAVNKPSSHSTSDHVHISPVPSTSRLALKNKIEDLINSNGIYESNGQYIFTSSAMADLYYILNGNSSPNYRVVNSFDSFKAWGSDSFYNYVNTTYLNNVNNYLSSLTSPYFIRVSNRHAPLYGVYNTDIYIYPNISQLAFLSHYNVSGSTNYTAFYNSSGNVIGLTYQRYSCSYRNNSFTNSSQSGTDDSFPGAVSWLNFYNNFPYVPDNVNSSDNSTNKYNYYCTSSLLLATEPNYGQQALNQNSGIFYFNNINNISVETNVVNNNDWSNIYNSYVTNVDNTYNTIVDNTGTDLTGEELRDLMSTYLDPIYKAIDDGLTDIADQVNYINEWLYKIYTNQSIVISRLDSLIQILVNNTGGSGGTVTSNCVWTTEQAAIVVDKITRLYTEQTDSNMDIIGALEYLKTRVNNIDGYTSDILDNSDTVVLDLATISTALDNIADKLDDIGGGVDITLPNIPLDVIDDIIDLLTDQVDDIVDSLDIVGNVLESAVPFCFLAAFGAILNGLSATPVEPEFLTWDIPFTNSDGSIDETITIDWSFLDTIHTIWISLIVILFVIGLMSVSFKIFTTFGTLVN